MVKKVAKMQKKHLEISLINRLDNTKILDIQVRVGLVLYVSSVCKSICDNMDSNIPHKVDLPT